ncbi:hypothetical protein GCM10010381_14090 [Streptomyces xantholiticus]|nr:hypothetical protein GCM10010381_14090 [Streptomyces xantholiticus]
MAITLMTGFPMPKRTDLFKTLASPDGIPLFTVQFEDIEPVRAVQDQEHGYQHTEYGWQAASGSDFDIVFYELTGKNETHGPTVRMRKARIKFIDAPQAGGQTDLIDPGYGMPGADLLARYINGPIDALNGLLNPPYSTRNIQSGGVSVADADAVDLTSFTDSARAFDRAHRFFVDQATVLAEWEEELGAEQAPWRGQAAGVFWNLIHQLRQNYDSYGEQMGGRGYHAGHSTVDGYTPTSAPGDALAQAQSALHTHLKNLSTAWTEWTKRYWHDPYHFLLAQLVQLGNSVIEHNLRQVERWSRQQGRDNQFHITAGPGFLQNIPGYGELGSVETWKRTGEEAVRQWNDGVVNLLQAAGTDALRGLKADWVNTGVGITDPLRTVNRDTLSSLLENEEADAAEDEAEKFQQEAEENAENLNQNLENIGDGFDSLNENVASTGTGLNDSLNGLGTGLNESLNGLGDNFNDGIGNLGDSLGNSPDGLLNPDGSPFVPPVGGSLLNPGLGPGTNGLTAGLTNPDGSVAELNPDGTLTTTYPDGTFTTLNPSLGTLSTTRPGGSTTTTDLDDGPLMNPDGSVSVAQPDGSVTTTHPDGTVTTLNPDTGVLTTLNPDGSLTATYPDGGSTMVDPDTGLATTTAPDGSTTTADLHDGPLQAPDGSTITLDPDTGALTTTNSDGTVTTLNPDTGTLTTTNPDGSTTTTDLNGTSLPDLEPGTEDPSGLNDGLHLPSGLDTELPEFTGGGVGDAGGGGYGALNDTLAADRVGSAAEDTYFDADEGLVQAGRSIGSPAAEMSAGVPLNQGLGGIPMAPGMAGPGMGGMGAGQGTGNAERTRNVFIGSGGAAMTSRRTSRPVALDEEDVVITRGGTGTSTGAVIAPQGGQAAAQQRTESASRDRTSWVTEDEDIWGTDEGGAPAVIGR